MEEENKIARLQLLEQNIQTLMSQKNTFQTELLEVENAERELEKVKEKAYKIVGNIMVSTAKEDLIKDLEERKKILEIRIKALEKNENSLREKASNLQQDITKEMQNESFKKRN